VGGGAAGGGAATILMFDAEDEPTNTARPAPNNSPPDVKSRDDVLAMGIDVYNEECRSIVMRWGGRCLGVVTEEVLKRGVPLCRRAVGGRTA
jgi:hypothetical protein